MTAASVTFLIDGVALTALLALGHRDLTRAGRVSLWHLTALFLALAPVALCSLWGGARGLALLALPLYLFVRALTRLDADTSGASHLRAGLAGGAAAALGPSGAIAVFAMLLIRVALCSAARRRRCALDGALVAFVPTVVLATLAFTSFLDTGTVGAIAALPFDTSLAPAAQHAEVSPAAVAQIAVGLFLVAPAVLFLAHRSREGLAFLASLLAVAATLGADGPDSASVLALASLATLIAVQEAGLEVPAGAVAATGASFLASLVLAPALFASAPLTQGGPAFWHLAGADPESPPAWGGRDVDELNMSADGARLAVRDGRLVFEKSGG